MKRVGSRARSVVKEGGKTDWHPAQKGSQVVREHEYPRTHFIYSSTRDSIMTSIHIHFAFEVRRFKPHRPLTTRSEIWVSHMLVTGVSKYFVSLANHMGIYKVLYSRGACLGRHLSEFVKRIFDWTCIVSPSLCGMPL